MAPQLEKLHITMSPCGKQRITKSRETVRILSENCQNTPHTYTGISSHPNTWNIIFISFITTNQPLFLTNFPIVCHHSSTPYNIICHLVYPILSFWNVIIQPHTTLIPTVYPVGGLKKKTSLNSGESNHEHHHCPTIDPI